MDHWKQKLLSAGLSAVVLLGACAPLTAMAAQTRAPQTQQSDVSTPAPSAQAQTETGNPEQESDAAQQAQLATQAKVTEAEAVAAVQAAYSGSTVTVQELDGENGRVIYDLKVQPADGGRAFEAAVDAVTGELLPAESDD